VFLRFHRSISLASLPSLAYSWSRTDRLKCPKNGKVLRIPISEGLYRLLESGLAPETVRLLTGHSAGMTARYSRIQLTNIKNHPMIDFPASNPFQSAIVPSNT
jgi:hypothetical protein